MQLLLGLILVFSGGALAGNVFTPIKFMRRYHFEQYWLIYSLVGTVIIPWALALLTIPHLFGVYASLPLSSILLAPLFAFSWGAASTLGGLCVSRIGLSLTYALIIGIGAAAGTLIPMLYFSPEVLSTFPGIVIISGIVLMICGLYVITVAGRKKEVMDKQYGLKDEAALPEVGTMKGSFRAGLIMAALAGILSSGLNFSFAFSQRIADAAVASGATKSNATYAIWAIAMLGGMIPNIGYGLYLCAINRSWGRFLMSPLTDLPLSVLIGAAFIGSTILYGLGTIHLGSLGTSIGWGIMQITQIVMGNIVGFTTGEWKIAGRKPTQVMLWGLTILVVASILMAYGNHLNTLR